MAKMESRQCIVNEGTEDELICSGFRETTWRKCIFYALTVCSLGILFLVCYWKPDWKLRIRAVRSDFKTSTHVILSDKFKQSHVKRIKLLCTSASEDSEIKLTEQNGNEPIHSFTTKQAFTIRDIDSKPKRHWQHRFQKYIWTSDTFVPLRGLDYRSSVQGLRNMADGLGKDCVNERRMLFGANNITIEITPYIVMLFREIIHPFYAFQIFSILVWCIEAYFTLAAVIALMSLISISLSLYMTRKENEMIHKMSSGSDLVKVLSGSEFVSRDSTLLLPGDVIEIEDKVSTIWCDCVLLSGTCVVDESMLTGESSPLIKTPLACSDTGADKELYDVSRHKQHTLYGGTKVVDIQSNKTEQLPRALVIKTGFYTEKGRMIESMVTPTPVDFKFYNDSLRFILMMAILGFIGGIVAITVLALQGATAGHIVTRVLDLITIVVPPGLPAALTIATLYAHRRLRLAKIYCISPPRINISGKINCMCFDKTGTLTEDGLKLWGITKCTNRDENTIGDGVKFSDTVHDYSKLSQCDHVGYECINALACCHSLVTMGGKVAGDPVDMELFRASDWVINDPCDEWSRECSKVLSPASSQGYRDEESIGILRLYQFNSVLQRMSVIGKRKRDQTRVVYVKGAPETIVDLCIENTVPSDFKSQLQHFTSQGYRVLALASKNLDNQTSNVSELSRKSVESELNFLALVILMNPLKQNTRETIAALRSASIRTVMSTGDNLETAISVAKKCDMTSENDRVVVVEAKPLENTHGITVTYKLVSSESKEKKLIRTHSDDNTSFVFMERGISAGYHMALTGATFSLIRENSPRLFERVLACASIFARMKPDHKKQLVEGLQEMQYIVGMCGDGANDCGAMKAAHAGVALAKAESSIVAPFTSMKKDISSCYKIIREGRAALVTSFGMIKYLCLYSFVQYLTLIVLYTKNSYMTDSQFLFADLGVTGIVVLFFAIGGAAKILSKERPHKSLVSPIMLTCLLLQVLFIILLQVVVWVTLKSQPWHTPLVVNMTHPKQNIESEENTVLFYTACFQYLILAFIFYKGPPYRKPIYRNVVYLVLMILLSCWTVVMLFAAVPPIDGWFSLMPLKYQTGFKFILLGYYFVYLILAIFVEKFLVESRWFKIKLKMAFQRCVRSRGVDASYTDSQGKLNLSYTSLHRTLFLDTSWPPIGGETVIKT